MAHEYIEDCLAFSQPISLGDIEILLSCRPDQLIMLWSLQQVGFITKLEETGCLTGNPDFAFSKEFGSLGKKAAYDWLQNQLCKNITDYNGSLVIWASLTKIASTRRENDKLIRLNVKRLRLILTWYTSWVALLDLMRTPDARVISIHARAEAFECERAAREEVERRFPEPRPMNVVAENLPSRAEVLANMVRMFDLSLARQPGFLWMADQDTGQPCVLQALLPEVFWSDIQGVPVDAEIDPAWR